MVNPAFDPWQEPPDALFPTRFGTRIVTDFGTSTI
jgi:hypothetical protein